MADVVYAWPSRDASSVIGKRQSRLDGMPKATGAAKYTYDVNLPDQLIAIGLGCPHAHCRVKAIDVDAANFVPGVVHVHVLRAPDTEVRTQGELIAVVAAETEGAAREGISKLKVEFELLDVFVNDQGPRGRKASGPHPTGRRKDRVG